MRATIFVGVALAGVLAVRCGSSDSPGPIGVVQLVSVTTGGLSISCGKLNHLANPDSLYVHAHMVNTTAGDVAIDSIGSAGTIIRASNESYVGMGALNLTSVPFTPKPTVLMAHTGDVTMTVSYSTNALCSSAYSSLDYMDVMASVRITTPVGQYVSQPLTIHVTYAF